MKYVNNQYKRLKLQSFISLLCMPFLYPMIIFWLRFIQGYKITELKKVRQEFKQIVSSHQDGLLICPNHLTYIDSIILIWAFSNPWSYLINYRTLCWNLPKAVHVHESWLYRTICYIGKCLLITNDQQQSQQSMDKASYLLNSGQYVMVFPEGTRSKSGRINTENFVYGVGKLHLDSQQKQVLCVYLRGENQKEASKMPIKSEQFNIALKLVTITTQQKGRRAMRDVSTQMIEHLVDMEQKVIDQG